ncbi:methylmalonyl Co-A mutase-associated GTPase MeaB [Chryseolinea sp. H1M3-3]|uniref:methylmalonyl Co-A mutase-associated GTPase MeaB n=1 Tax=Chryseolinea sp. H1M3-3 TaxID=3034144 RepID=UPI0023EB8E46|nr:methylmalonyl Co-A mutase-associated GTPase MeaB [Chryseolinea sp. H1M3-3]
MRQSIKSRPLIDSLAASVLQGDRMALSQAITIIESNLEQDKKLSTELLDKIIHATGKSIRVGITGVPGVGKSSFIEALGRHVTAFGKRLAVLTVDPSSQVTKGSILGDKTRMEELSKNPLAYIRPSASGNALGGVTQTTHDVVLLCEAAGYEIIIIETVGVGQSEINVKSLVDFFLLLMLAGAGDELQGIKKGITEIADAIVITKADGGNISSADAAKATYQQALHLQRVPKSGWLPRVITTSAYAGTGIDEVWRMILAYKELTTANGFFADHRRLQELEWFEDYFKQLLALDLQQSPIVQSEKKKLEALITEQKLSPKHAAANLLKIYHREIKSSED